MRDLQACIENETSLSKTSRNALNQIITNNKLQFDHEFLQILEEIIVEHAMDQGRTFQLNFTEAFNLYTKQREALNGNNNTSMVSSG